MNCRHAEILVMAINTFNELNSSNLSIQPRHLFELNVPSNLNVYLKHYVITERSYLFYYVSALKRVVVKFIM